MEGTTNGVNWVRGDWDTSPVFYEYKGESRTLGDWARVKGIPSNTLKTRIKRGWSIERAIENPPSRGRTKIKNKIKKKRVTWGRKLTAFGKTMTLSEWAEYIDVSRETISYRLKQGWALEKALSKKAKYTTPKEDRAGYGSMREATPWEKRIYLLCSGARHRRPEDFTLEWQGVYEGLKKRGFKCAQTGIPLHLNNKGTSPWAPSIDRIDPKKGYSPENVQVVCYMYNTAKNKFDPTDVERMAKALVASSA